MTNNRGIRKAAAWILGLAAIAGAAPSAKAGLIGHSIKGEYLYPNTTSVDTTMGTQTVSPTATFDYFGLARITVADAAVTITFTRTMFWDNSTFSGFRLTDLSGNLGVSSIALGAATNVTNFNLSRVGLTAGTLQVNQAGLNVVNGQQVVLNLTSAPAVPEPPALISAAAGVACVGLAGLRRRKSA